MNGLLVLDKPAGITSHDAIVVVRSALSRRTRVGHAGTLDPFATGVLLALLGDATRLAPLATALPKTYDAKIRFGVATRTLDPDGEVTARADPGPAAPPALEAALNRFVGEIEQVPPAFSALKWKGRRAYELARLGEPPELPPRRVRIDRLERRDDEWPETRLLVACGAGTYVRALARDLGAAIGLPASLAALRRTAIGPYRAGDGRVPDSTLTEAAVAASLRPPLGIVRAAGLPETRLPRDEARAFCAGAPVRTDAAPGDVAVLPEDRDLLLGLGRSGGGRLRPAKVMACARREYFA